MVFGQLPAVIGKDREGIEGPVMGNLLQAGPVDVHGLKLQVARADRCEHGPAAPGENCGFGIITGCIGDFFQQVTLLLNHIYFKAVLDGPYIPAILPPGRYGRTFTSALMCGSIKDQCIAAEGQLPDTGNMFFIRVVDQIVRRGTLQDNKYGEDIRGH